MRRRATLTALAAAALCAVLPGQAAAADGADTLTLGGKECNLIEVPTAAPVGVGRCPGVRPGALVETPVGFCTMNFLFRDARGNRYIGTAGHCILNRGERQWGSGGGPIAKDGQGRAIGRFRYAVLSGEKDFALIELNQSGSNRAKARMCHFGGPTGVDGSQPRRRTVALQHYGQGIVTGNLTPARTFLANGMPNPNHVFAKGIVAPGDSGGPVTRRGSGRAVGVVVTVGVHLGGSLGDNGTVGITRIPPQEARAETVIGRRLEIVKAPQS